MQKQCNSNKELFFKYKNVKTICLGFLLKIYKRNKKIKKFNFKKKKKVYKFKVKLYYRKIYIRLKSSLTVCYFCYCLDLFKILKNDLKISYL